MTNEQLDQNLKSLAQKFEALKNKLIIEYCDANNKYKVGDVFTDYCGSIRIKKIGYSVFGNPCCTYTGEVLKKDGTPMKKETIRVAYQSNEAK